MTTILFGTTTRILLACVSAWRGMCGIHWMVDGASRQRLRRMRRPMRRRMHRPQSQVQSRRSSPLHSPLQSRRTCLPSTLASMGPTTATRAARGVWSRRTTTSSRMALTTRCWGTSVIVWKGSCGLTRRWNAQRRRARLMCRHRALRMHRRMRRRTHRPMRLLVRLRRCRVRRRVRLLRRCRLRRLLLCHQPLPVLIHAATGRTSAGGPPTARPVQLAL